MGVFADQKPLKGISVNFRHFCIQPVSSLILKIQSQKVSDPFQRMGNQQLIVLNDYPRNGQALSFVAKWLFCKEDTHWSSNSRSILCNMSDVQNEYPTNNTLLLGMISCSKAVMESVTLHFGHYAIIHGFISIVSWKCTCAHIILHRLTRIAQIVLQPQGQLI